MKRGRCLQSSWYTGEGLTTEPLESPGLVTGFSGFLDVSILWQVSGYSQESQKAGTTEEQPQPYNGKGKTTPRLLESDFFFNILENL